MSFSEYLSHARSGVVTFDESWAQGRAGFGGLVAALLYENMRSQIADDKPLRSLQISFVGPVAADTPFELRSQVLRSGKSVDQVQGSGLQDDKVQLSMMAAFGQARESSITVEKEASTFAEDPLAQRSLAGMEKFVPAFTQHFEFRYCTALPFTGSSGKTLRGFLRFAEPPVQIGVPELLALIDAWPPTPLPMLKQFAPASSLTWSIDFVHPMPVLAPDEFCQYEASIHHAGEGYASTSAFIRNAKGQLMAMSHQTVTHFA